MSHGVSNDIDAKRIRALQRVFLKILDFFPFSFPSVRHVVVVAKESDQTVLVVEVAKEMWRSIVAIERSVSIFVGHAALPRADARHLRQFGQIVNQVKDLVV